MKHIFCGFYFTLGVYLGMPDGDEVARGMELAPVTLFLRPIGMYVELVMGPPSSGIVDTWNTNISIFFNGQCAEL